MTASASVADEASGPRPLRLFMVAGEESGDRLGAPLIEALRARYPGAVSVEGVGGTGMLEAGLKPLFAMEEIAVMGMDEIVRRLPALLGRIRQTAEAVIAARPDVLVIIDAPDFTHRVARRVRRRAPEVPIVDYVSPTVWAWRPGRARAMARYVDRLLAILPFEPQVHADLGGPPTTYVGHPLIASGTASGSGPAGAGVGEGSGAVAIDQGVAAASIGDDERLVLLVLPGSRTVEVDRLLAVFGEALAIVEARHPGGVRCVVPTVASLRERLVRETAGWPGQVEIVADPAGKAAAFGAARAAIAASGTVTLELALAGVPMVVAYRLDTFYRQVMRLDRVVKIVRAPSMVLPNIILGRNAIPELLEDAATPEALAGHALALLAGGPERERQVAALADLRDLMAIEGATPSARAAEEILALVAPRARTS